MLPRSGNQRFLTRQSAVNLVALTVVQLKREGSLSAAGDLPSGGLFLFCLDGVVEDRRREKFIRRAEPEADGQRVVGAEFTERCLKLTLSIKADAASAGRMVLGPLCRGRQLEVADRVLRQRQREQQIVGTHWVIRVFHPLTPPGFAGLIAARPALPKLLLQFSTTLIENFPFILELVRRQSDDRWRVFLISVHDLSGAVIEERSELIKLALTQRVELVVMTDGTAGGHTEKHGGRCLDPVHHVANFEFGRNRPSLRCGDVAAVEPGGDLLIERRVGEHVPRNLLDNELVERHVRVERVDHPIAVRPHLAVIVNMHPVSVSVPGRVEPESRSMFSCMFRIQQCVDVTLESRWLRIPDKRVEHLRRRREAG